MRELIKTMHAVLEVLRHPYAALAAGVLLLVAAYVCLGPYLYRGGTRTYPLQATLHVPESKSKLRLELLDQVLPDVEEGFLPQVDRVTVNHVLKVEIADYERKRVSATKQAWAPSGAVMLRGSGGLALRRLAVVEDNCAGTECTPDDALRLELSMQGGAVALVPSRKDCLPLCAVLWLKRNHALEMGTQDFETWRDEKGQKGQKGHQGLVRDVEGGNHQTGLRATLTFAQGLGDPSQLFLELAPTPASRATGSTALAAPASHAPASTAPAPASQAAASTPGRQEPPPVLWERLTCRRLEAESVSKIVLTWGAQEKKWQQGDLVLEGTTELEIALGAERDGFDVHVKGNVWRASINGEPLESPWLRWLGLLLLLVGLFVTTVGSFKARVGLADLVRRVVRRVFRPPGPPGPGDP